MSSIYSQEYQLVISTLRNSRLEQGVTQTTLAKAFGKPQSFIAKVENGERRLDVVEFIHLAKLLSIDPASVIKKVMDLSD
ncbi:helix-turn-helix domain-containing protein [Pseudocitrobacter sp. 73]|uniref:helix-turn-helix domain-containing protein n=1 Tax=Pseudocitrobacter sp. 73 TaxID=2605731 RepID=UPI0011ED85B7|nr:helix-turn-helix transcriptional regulator [Pseudocitrobacter sp. 73]KAA1051713.1 helix-turn-helix transcriptional regulator [Pseudocitrobacter sp. 73]